MEKLLDIIGKIEETQTAIKRTKIAIKENPDEKSLSTTLESLYKRHQNLEEDFLILSDADYVDVCTYRLFAEDGIHPRIASITRAINDFQDLFSVVYDAIKNGPKERGRVSEEITIESSFSLGYTFTGSVGFVLTIPNERLLIGETNLDKAMTVIFDMVRADDASKIAQFARQIGVAPIRQIYKWATDHVQSALNADIKWRRREEVKASLFIQVPELEKLQRTIDQTSDEREEIITVVGQLVGADIKTLTFHMAFENGTEDMKGKMSTDLIPVVGILNLPKKYMAKIKKATKTYYSIEKEDISYQLISLE